MILILQGLINVFQNKNPLQKNRMASLFPHSNQTPSIPKTHPVRRYLSLSLDNYNILESEITSSRV